MNPSSKPKSSQVQSERNETLLIRERVVQHLAKDPKGYFKAAILLTQWMNRSSKKNNLKKAA